MKFYAFADTDSTYDLILDPNPTLLVAWNSSNTNKTTSQVKNELDKLVSDSNWKIEPRLITADEVAEITGAKDTLDWTSDKTYAYTPVKGTSVSWFYLNGKDGTDGSTNNVYGYWTSSRVARSSDHAWFVINLGYLSSDHSVDRNF